jgi:thiamine kinase-like enzyme
MSYLNKMYGRGTKTEPVESNKNPNRVAGGLRAQGVDTLSILGEDGQERQIPSQRYVQSIEEQVKKQRAAIDVLERKLARTESSLEKVTAALSRS